VTIRQIPVLVFFVLMVSTLTARAGDPILLQPIINKKFAIRAAQFAEHLAGNVSMGSE
jgi:hypothetical protein